MPECNSPAAHSSFSQRHPTPLDRKHVGDSPTRWPDNVCSTGRILTVNPVAPLCLHWRSVRQGIRCFTGPCSSVRRKTHVNIPVLNTLISLALASCCSALGLSPQSSGSARHGQARAGGFSKRRSRATPPGPATLVGGRLDDQQRGATRGGRRTHEAARYPGAPRCEGRSAPFAVHPASGGVVDATVTKRVIPHAAPSARAYRPTGCRRCRAAPCG